MSLLVGLEVVCRVEEDEREADDCRDAAEDGAKEEAKVVEGEAAPERFLDDVLVGEGAVALRHRLIDLLFLAALWPVRVLAFAGWRVCLGKAMRQ